MPTGSSLRDQLMKPFAGRVGRPRAQSAKAALLALLVLTGSAGALAAQEQFGFVAHKRSVHHVAISPNGEEWATIGAGEGIIRVWRVKDQVCLHTLPFPKRNRAALVEFLPPGDQLLVTTGQRRSD